MYKIFIRPVFFLFSPESIHKFVDFSLILIFKLPFTKGLAKKLCQVKDNSLQRDLFGLKFPNPVGFAAGFDKQGKLYNELSHFGFGFIEIGTVTPKPQPGNPKPRLFRLTKDSSLINRMGFNNVGLDEMIHNLKKNKAQIIIGGNIGKNTLTPNEKAVDDYAECFEKLHPYVDYFAVNVSCPNIKDLKQLQDKEHTKEILTRLIAINQAKEIQKPILLKISPDLNEQQLDEIIELVDETKIQGIIATNTSTSRLGLKTKPSKIEKIGNGGLSGKAITQRSTEVIAYLHKKSQGRFPIIGVGGIHSAEDAIEKLNAGADLIQIYTGFIYEGPFFVKKILKKIINVN